jgi:hypothetical protein
MPGETETGVRERIKKAQISLLIGLHFYSSRTSRLVGLLNLFPESQTKLGHTLRYVHFTNKIIAIESVSKCMASE